jgi:putative ABC transport system permease protein
MLMTLLQDVRFALRLMRKNPGFTAVAVIALALGIGANNTVFTLVNTILLKSLPFRDGHEIVSLGCNDFAKGTENMAVSYLDFKDWSARSRSFQGVAAFSIGTMNLSNEGAVPERLSGAWLSADAFKVIGLSPVLGRDFLPAEDRPGASSVVLLGYGVWQNRFGGEPGILGKTIRVNSIPATVIGIMPRGMKFPFDAELWMPLLQTKDRESRNFRDLQVFARLGNGVSIAQAGSELNGIARQLAQGYPKTNAGIGAQVMSFNERYNGGRMKMVLWIMLGAVGFVLLIACVNVANLLLSRAAHRSREISIRSALGAGRLRIIRQLLIESVLLSLLGAAGGLLISIAGVRWFRMSLSLANVEGMPYWLDFSMDWRVFGYLLAVCIATSVIFGLVPALKAARVNLVEALKEGGQSGGESSKPRRLASSLVVAQLTLTLVLLSGAGMMIQDFLGSQRIHVGLNPQNLLTMRLGLPEQKYPTPESRVAFHEGLAQRLRAIPGIQSIAITSNLPIDGSLTGMLQFEGQAVDDREKLPRIPLIPVSPAYFETLGAPLSRGRAFHAHDGMPGAEVVIVNERFVAQYWPGEDPLGKRIHISSEPNAPWVTVIGVIPQINREIESQANTESIVYVPYRQLPVRFVSLVARTLVPPSSLAQVLRREVQALDPDLPVYRVRTMEEHLSQQLWPYRVFGALFGAFAAISLLLSATGIYGVTAYAVSRRTQEIGLRMALGADGRNVLWLVLKRGLQQLAIGVVLGLLGAWTVGRVLEKLLVETSAADPAVNGTASFVLCGIALAACVIPAWKAARLDPLSALRIRN